jgi:hypothetical protein
MKRLLLTLAFIAGTPCFAQSLSPGDIPAINLESNNARGGVTGVLPLANGGTGGSAPNINLATQVTGILSNANGGSGVSAAAVTNGQLLVGKTSDHSLNLATLTAGANVTVTNGAGTITVAAANTYTPTVSQPTASTLAAAFDNAYLIDTTANACAVTLPIAVGHAGHQIVVFLQVKGGSNAVTMASTSSQTINAAAASGFGISTANKSYTFMSDGANFVVIASE